MININTQFERNRINLNKKENLMMLEIKGLLKDRGIESKNLNISLCIDISGSMSEGIERVNHFRSMNFNKNIREERKIKSKMSLAKEAAVNALSIMKDGDFISVVSFDDSITVVKEATKITKENRIDIINAINSLETNGMTNIHGGWVKSVEEIAKNMKKDSLNRVILLTDGQANTGKTNPDDICVDVSRIANKNISTSTFGIGCGFNELLLSSMSQTGLGNFYFIKNEDNFKTLFNEEFTGLTNICASEIKMSLNLKKDVLSKMLTELKVTEGVYQIQDITKDSVTPILMNINTSSMEIGKHNLGEVVISFKDADGNSHSVKESIEIEIVSEEEWLLCSENEEIKVQEILLDIVKNKLKAKEFFDFGDAEGGKRILRGLSASMSNINSSDSRLQMQSSALNQTILSADNQDNALLSKTMHYESYRTSKGKNI